MPLNACELEIDLFCHGMRLPLDVSLDGARGISRTRAGLGSGLEIAIPAAPLPKREIWVNVPVVEPFVRASPYLLTGDPAGGYAIVDERDGSRYPARLPREPAWYSRLTSRDMPMNRIGVLQGTYLGIYVNPVCAFWNYSPRRTAGSARPDRTSASPRRRSRRSTTSSRPAGRRKRSRASRSCT